ncbi:MAG: ATP-binding protein [Acidobacteriia bacterium]|nr:ATP-binding protein [Terriglobia bacterium]
MSWKDINDQFTIEDIGAPLLANLAKGIYTPEAVLREYVQNAADAYSDLEELKKKKLAATDKQIDIYLQDNDTLAIQDSGVGMTLQEIKHYKRIALSPKLGKDRAGFRGIGIWAGFSACDALQVETSKVGDPHKYRLTLDFGEMRKLVHENIDVKQLLDDRYSIEEDAAPAGDHYTQVRLVKLHNEFKDLLSQEELERIVRQILPCRIDTNFKYAAKITEQLRTIDGFQEFIINVKDIEVVRRFPTNVTEPVFATLALNDEEYASVWYCTSPTVRSFKANEPSNFRLRVRNIGVGGPGIYSQENGLHWGVRSTVSSPELLDWYVGEIHIVRTDVRPNTPRSELELDSESRRAITLIRDFYEERITHRRANSDVNSHITQVKEAAQDISENKTYEVADASRLLKHMQKYEALSKPKKTKLQGIDAEKRRILKQLEAKDLEIAKSRREIIEFLELIVGPASTKAGKKGQSKAGKATNGNGTSASERATTADTVPIADYEKVLSDILLAVERTLGDQDELASKLSEAIEDIFKRHGLLVTA